MAYFNPKKLQTVMKRVVIRKDLLNKTEYAKKFNLNRPQLDQMIEDGEVVVERISNKDYVRIPSA